VTSLTENLNETITGMTGSTEGTMKTLEALHKASDELLKTPTENTWYLTGTEEVCAHIIDMALRAENSVVISLLDPACLDLKQLAKVKKPRRRVLVIPESEETDPAFESLQGWRIWQTKSPMLLAIIDDKEIVIGGARESDAPLAVASIDDAYLRLYHDVLGPRIVSLRVSA
jgi:hypothetical protein